MCGRYASSRKPEDLVEEFEIDKVEVAETLVPDYNVAPTKQVYAVVQRPRVVGGQDRSLRAPAAHAEVGPGAVLGQGPLDRQPLINARMETVDEKPAFRRAFAARRCLLPADGYYEWYATEQKTKAGQAASSSRSSSTPPTAAVLAMAGLYEIWRDPTRDDDDPRGSAGPARC